MAWDALKEDEVIGEASLATRTVEYFRFQLELNYSCFYLPQLLRPWLWFLQVITAYSKAAKFPIDAFTNPFTLLPKFEQVRRNTSQMTYQDSVLNISSTEHSMLHSNTYILSQVKFISKSNCTFE